MLVDTVLMSDSGSDRFCVKLLTSQVSSRVISRRDPHRPAAVYFTYNATSLLPDDDETYLNNFHKSLQVD